MGGILPDLRQWCLSLIVYCRCFISDFDLHACFFTVGDGCSHTDDDFGEDEMNEFTKLYKEWKGVDENYRRLPVIYKKVRIFYHAFMLFFLLLILLSNVHSKSVGLLIFCFYLLLIMCNIVLMSMYISLVFLLFLH